MVDPKKIKITLPIPVGGGGSGSSVAWMFLHGLTVEKSAERVEKKSGMFSGAEEEAPREKALKKIQIEIVRNLKGRGGRTNSPVRRSLKPYDTLVLPRRHDEGSSPLFDFIQALTETTKRIISMDSDHRRSSRSRSPLRSKNRSRSPLDNRRSSNLYSDAGSKNGGGDVKTRLGNKTSGGDRDRENHRDSRRASSPRGGANRGSSVHARLGQRDVRARLSRTGGAGGATDDEDEVLDRDELESQRPVVPPPWEANPEMVPRAGYYFEHDDREGDRDSRSFRGGFRGGYRGGFRGGSRGGGYQRDRFQRGGGGYRGRGGGRGFYDRRGRDSSPDWKHDKFDPGPGDDGQS